MTECSCPEERSYSPIVMTVAHADWDDWKSSRKIRKYVPGIGVKHTWEYDGQTFSARHPLDTGDPS